MSKSKNEIGLNLRVTEYLDQGVREYMEDYSACHFEKEGDNIIFGFFGIFDGHGGPEAAQFAKSVLVNEIKSLDKFWSSEDNDVVAAIKEGFLNTHQLMWKERDKWPRTASGYKSTSGTTASVAIIKNQKLFVGHVGDSAIVIGQCDKEDIHSDWWRGKLLTEEHKPSNPKEKERIERVGGSLMRKAGVDRVVWCRPKINPMMNSSRSSLPNKNVEYERIPFLAVARSLGDLWSYDIINEEFHVSPEPDVEVFSLQTVRDRCIIIGSDGLWNMVTKEAAVEIVRICERETERKVFLDPESNAHFFYNPAASLVKYSVKKWNDRNMRADNISAMVILLDPPGPSMSKRREQRRQKNLMEMDIPKAFPKEINLESFMLSIFLVECANWKNANKLSDKGDQASNLNPNQAQAAAVTENITNVTPASDDPIASSRSSVEMKPPTVTGKHSLQSVLKKRTPTKAVLVDFDLDDENYDDDSSSQLTERGQKHAETEAFEEDEEAETECTSNSRPRVNILTKEFLTISNYNKYTTAWRNDTEMWNAIAEDLWILECFNLLKIEEHISSYGVNSIPQRLEIIPWAFAAKRVLSEMNECRLLASNFDLFHPVWLQFYERHIRPIVGAKHLSKQKMYECIQSLKSLLVPYLKETLKSSQQSVSVSPFIIPTSSTSISQLNKRSAKKSGTIQVIHKSEPPRKRPALSSENGLPSTINLPPIVPLRIHSSPLVSSNNSIFMPFTGGRSVNMQRISAKYMAKPVVTPNEELVTRDIESRMQSRIVNPMSIPGSRIMESVVARAPNAQPSCGATAISNRFSLQTASLLKPPLFSLSSQQSSVTPTVVNSSLLSLKAAEQSKISLSNPPSSDALKENASSSMSNENVSAVTTAVPDSTSKDKEPTKKADSEKKKVSTTSISTRNTRNTPRKESSTSTRVTPNSPSSKIKESPPSKAIQSRSKSFVASPKVTRSAKSMSNKVTKEVNAEDKSPEDHSTTGSKFGKKITVKFLGRNIDIDMTGDPILNRKKISEKPTDKKKNKNRPPLETNDKEKSIAKTVSTKPITVSKRVLSTRRSLTNVKKAQPKNPVRNLRSLRKRISV